MLVSPPWKRRPRRLGDPQGKRIVVPVHIKSRHTANGILKEAGISKAF
jgi:predicted RNA binding protein YcfA (HicA-like mRNA interferase family)